jgi:heme-degrading monooxygenase HmoA
VTPQPADPFVSITFWRVGRGHVLQAAARMALDRRPIRRAPGLRFAKLLGTSDGRTFAPRDADLRRWALLTVWESPDAARDFETDGVTHRRWNALAVERLRIDLRPLSSRGTWSGREPFGRPRPRRDQADPHAPGGRVSTDASGGPVAAITRARLRLGRTRIFRAAVPDVAADLAVTPGLRLAAGIGEAPIGLQGTFSLWDDAGSLTEFAHRRAPHAAVVRRTSTEGWYAEELFARFAVLAVEGTFDGQDQAAPTTLR